MAHMARFIISDSPSEFVNEMTVYNVVEARDGISAIQMKQNSLSRGQYVVYYQNVSNNFSFNPDDGGANVGAKVAYISDGILTTGFFWGRDYGRIIQSITQFLGATPTSIAPVPGIYDGTLVPDEAFEPEVPEL